MSNFVDNNNAISLMNAIKGALKKIIFVGTQAEIDAAISSGDISENTIVVTLDNLPLPTYTVDKNPDPIVLTDSIETGTITVNTNSNGRITAVSENTNFVTVSGDDGIFTITRVISAVGSYSTIVTITIESDGEYASVVLNIPISIEIES